MSPSAGPEAQGIGIATWGEASARDRARVHADGGRLVAVATGSFYIQPAR